MNHPRENLIALAGNPNCGKTTLFNAITGARQHVGNYPGITVEKKEGYCQVNGRQIQLVDLPGTYSLTAYSLEELVARNFLIQDRPSAVINIVDSSNLERNLYLTVQLLELGIPVLVALNMVDMAAARGLEINCEELGRRLRLPVIPTVARTGRGKEELLEAAAQLAQKDAVWEPLHISYGPDIDPVLDKMEAQIRAAGFLTDSLPARWTALKYLEADEEVIRKGKEKDPALSGQTRAIRRTSHAAPPENSGQLPRSHYSRSPLRLYRRPAKGRGRQAEPQSRPALPLGSARPGAHQSFLRPRPHDADNLRCLQVHFHIQQGAGGMAGSRLFGAGTICGLFTAAGASQVADRLGRDRRSGRGPRVCAAYPVHVLCNRISRGYGIPCSSSLYARPRFPHFRPSRQFSHGLHHFGRDSRRLRRSRGACHQDPQKPARAALPHSSPRLS